MKQYKLDIKYNEKVTHQLSIPSNLTREEYIQALPVVNAFTKDITNNLVEVKYEDTGLPYSFIYKNALWYITMLNKGEYYVLKFYKQSKHFIINKDEEEI